MSSNNNRIKPARLDDVDTVEEAEIYLDEILNGSENRLPIGLVPFTPGAHGHLINPMINTSNIHHDPYHLHGIQNQHPHRKTERKKGGYVGLEAEDDQDEGPESPTSLMLPMEVGAEEDKNGISHERGGEEWMRDIWAPPNRAVVASYFCVGVMLNFLFTPVSYYLVAELDTPPNQQSVIFTLVGLPWSFKLVYGFVSDNFPIWGMRRKPYLIGGWVLCSACSMMLAALGRPKVPALAVLLLMMTVAFMMSDVATDAIIVERSKHEKDDSRGKMQATGYASRFVGSLFGSILGTVLYNKERWGWGCSIAQIFVINAIIPMIVVIPFTVGLRETAIVTQVEDRTAALKSQCAAIFKALSLNAVHVPMAFVFVYNVMQVPNAAWRSFLVEGLGFQNFDLGLISIAGSLFSSCGLLLYRQFFMATGWRQIYVVTAGLTFFFSILQLLLILRVNQRFGISDLGFALGDDALAELVMAVQFLPVCMMYASMCPTGTEGTTYAILTTLGNVAGAVAYSIGTLMSGLWDVENATLASGNFTGMWKLTLLTSLIQPIPLIMVRWLPANQAEQKEMQQSNKSNYWGGVAFCTVLFVSLFWTVVEAIIQLAG